MIAGMQWWDASGALVLDATHSIMRFYDLRMLSNGQGGSVVDSRFAQGRCWVSFQPDRYIGFGSGGTIHPQFSYNPSTNTLTWSYAAKNSAQWDEFVGGILYYGGY